MAWTTRDLLGTVAGSIPANRALLGQVEPAPGSPQRRAKGTEPSGDLLPRKLPDDLPLVSARRGGRNREAVIQRRIVLALRRAGFAALAINGEVGLGGKVGMLLQVTRKAMGYEPGTPEVIVALPGGKVLWLEVKAPADGQGVLKAVRRPRRAGRLSAEQKMLHELLRGLGHRVEVAHGEDEAVQAARMAS